MQYYFDKNSSVEAKLRKTSEEMNKSLPMTLDAETRLDTTLAFEKSFAYRYTLINYALEELDKDVFTAQMKPQIKNGYCHSEEMQQFVTAGVTVRYLYYGKSGKQVASIEYKPSDCDIN